jgi:hypothetical protein
LTSVHIVRFVCKASHLLAQVTTLPAKSLI